MKKLFKNPIFTFILGMIIVGSIGVVATVQFQASEVGYKGTTVDRALDTLYEKANAKTVVCALVEGQGKTVGSKYYCNPGDNVYRAFYVLKVNTDDVELIMEKNLSDEVGTQRTMTWNDAVHFFDENNPGYATKQAWNNVISVDLPGAQEIADAGGITGFNTSNSNNIVFFGNNNAKNNYAWLYNYTRACKNYGCSYGYEENDSSKSFGYWTKDLMSENNSHAWDVYREGGLFHDSLSDTRFGVRPVIKVAKSSLSS